MCYVNSLLAFLAALFMCIILFTFDVLVLCIFSLNNYKISLIKYESITLMYIQYWNIFATLKS